MYPFVIKVHYWDEIHDPAEIKHTNILIYAESFADAAQQTENYFGDDLEDMKITCVGDDGTVFEVSRKIADALTIGLGNYKDGIKHIKESEEFQE